jgi:hypothetical protein
MARCSGCILSATSPHVSLTNAALPPCPLPVSSAGPSQDGAAADMLPGAFSAADPNISHDLLAGLTTGSWIRGELQMAMHGSDTEGGGAGMGAPGAGALPTILETSRSSICTTSAATSGRGGTVADGNLHGSVSVSVNQTSAYESDGQMSSSSTTARARAAEGAAGRCNGGSGSASVAAVGAASTLPASQVRIWTSWVWAV